MQGGFGPGGPTPSLQVVQEGGLLTPEHRELKLWFLVNLFSVLHTPQGPLAYLERTTSSIGGMGMGGPGQGMGMMNR